MSIPQELESLKTFAELLGWTELAVEPSSLPAGQWVVGIPPEGGYRRGVPDYLHDWEATSTLLTQYKVSIEFGHEAMSGRDMVAARIKPGLHYATFYEDERDIKAAACSSVVCAVRQHLRMEAAREQIE